MRPATLDADRGRRHRQGRRARRGPARRHHGAPSAPPTSSRSAIRCRSPRSRSSSICDAARDAVEITRDLPVTGRTGVEMEALTAVSGRRPHRLRHVQGGRSRHADHGHPAAPQGRRQVRRVRGWDASCCPSKRRAAHSRAASAAAAERSLCAEALGRVLAQDVARPPHPAALRRLRHGRLCGARRRRREVPGARSSWSARAGRRAPRRHRSAPARPSRIFTGAPLPAAPTPWSSRRTPSATARRVEVAEGAPPGTYVRRAGLDFLRGRCALKAGTRLTRALSASPQR